MNIMIEFKKSQLNISERTRTSILPWKGQFSPELIEYLINQSCVQSTCIYDPFCGSGTVLLESILMNKDSIGTEVNPAAWYLSTLITLSKLSSKDRQHLLETLTRFEKMTKCHIELLNFIKSDDSFFSEKIALSCSLLLGMKNSANFSSETIQKGIIAVKKVITKMPMTDSNAVCHLEDARNSSLPSQSVDAVITSPPYINVFNYHQNYRPAIELLEWKPLEAAKSEIGANRKHRQNRYLTVIQYCLDMSQVLDELSRVCKKDSPLILVVGRESNVLGTAFKNSALIRDIMTQRNDISFIQSEERKFTNMYGQTIYEDVLIAKKNSSPPLKTSIEIARQVGLTAIQDVIECGKSEKITLLNDVVEKSSKIMPSAFLEINKPNYLKRV